MRTVFGREPELEEIDCFLDRLLQGPAALVLAGEAGIGKTTLWSAGLSAAESRGYRTLTARPAESEAVFSFAGLADLLEPAAVFTDCLIGQGVNERMLAQALDLGNHDAPTTTWFGPAFVAPMVRMWSGKIAEGIAGFAVLMQTMVERGQEATICLLGLYATRMACWAGDLESAQNYASMGRTASEHSGWAAGRAFATAAEAMVACLAGDAPTARQKVEEASGILGTESKFRTICMMSSLGALELSLGNYAAADRVLGPYVEFIWTSGVREPAVAAFVPDQAEALIGLGRYDEALDLIEWLSATGRNLDRAWALAAAARGRALMLASEGRLREAMAQIDEALLNHKRLRMPIEQARTLLVKGRLHRRNREKGAAQSRSWRRRWAYSRPPAPGPGRRQPAASWTGWACARGLPWS